MHYLLIPIVFLLSCFQLFAYDVTINGNPYRISVVTNSNFNSVYSLISSQPWWGNESLAASVASSVQYNLGTPTWSDSGPRFLHSRSPMSYDGEYHYWWNHQYWTVTPPGHVGVWGGSWHSGDFAVATLLVDTDNDGVYDLDDLDYDYDVLSDLEEETLALNPLSADSNGNGVSDLREAYEALTVEKVAVEAERDARPTQEAYDALEVEKALVTAERDARPTQEAYDALEVAKALVTAERDARPTQEAYDALEVEKAAVEAERDARPTQAAYDALEVAKEAVEAERDARPTQASYDAKVSELDALDSRVFALLPKEQASTAYDPILLDADSLGADQDYVFVSDTGDGILEFNFLAQEGQLRWYANGVELLNNSTIRIETSNHDLFNLESIVFDRWESENYFSETLFANSEQEAREQAADLFNSTYSASFTITDSNDTVLYSMPQVVAQPNDFSAYSIGEGSVTLLDAGSLGNNQDYTSVSDSGDGYKLFDFQAQQGQLRWWSNGVELLSNSIIRLSRADAQSFNLDSIEFDQWESESYFSEMIYANSEQEAKIQAAELYNQYYNSGSFTIRDHNGQILYAITPGHVNPDEFHAHSFEPGMYFVDYFGGYGYGNGLPAHTTLDIPNAEDLQYVDIAVNGYKVHVDGFNVSYDDGEYRVDYYGGSDASLQFSTLSIPMTDDSYYVDISTSGYKVHVDGFNVSYVVYDPPVATKTLEEYVGDLIDEHNSALVERDAAIVESDSKLSLQEIKDLRAGSTMVEIDNGQATLTMEIEESDDLGVWTNGSATSIQIPIDAEVGKKFYRFKMSE